VFAFSGKGVCPSLETLAYYEICPFPVNYESVMFYSTGPGIIKSVWVRSEPTRGATLGLLTNIGLGYGES
jgi:hypothetical protein